MFWDKVAGVYDIFVNKFFSSAPKEAREVLVQREHELFYGPGLSDGRCLS